MLVLSDVELMVHRRCRIFQPALWAFSSAEIVIMEAIEEGRLPYRVAHADEALDIYRKSAGLLGLLFSLLASNHFDDDVVTARLVVDDKVIDAVDSLEVLWFFSVLVRRMLAGNAWCFILGGWGSEGQRVACRIYGAASTAVGA